MLVVSSAILFLIMGIIGFLFYIKEKNEYVNPYDPKIYNYSDKLNHIIRLQTYIDDFNEFNNIKSVFTGDTTVYTFKIKDSLYNYTVYYDTKDSSLNFQFKESDELALKFSNLVLNGVNFLSGKEFIKLDKENMDAYTLNKDGFVYNNKDELISFKVNINLNNIFENYISYQTINIMKSSFINEDYISLDKGDIKVYKFKDDNDTSSYYIVEDKKLSNKIYISILSILDIMLENKYIKEFANKYKDNMYVETSNECYEIKYSVSKDEINFDFGIENYPESSILLKINKECIQNK